jgi:hypothetical protein
MNASRTRAGLAALLAVSATLAAAAPAGAATKPFSLVIAPGTPSVVAGGESVAMTATITNETTTQQMGSANLAPPQGFTVTAASIVAPGAGSAKPNSSCSVLGQTLPCVELRNLSLAPGATVSVQMTVSTPICVPPMSSHSWSRIEAKQANNFSGQPGNDMTLDAAHSSTSTTLDGACKLGFGIEPHNVVVGQNITGTDWDSTGPAVTVQVLDVNGNVVSGSTASVTTMFGNNPGLANPAGVARIVNAAGGVATFGDLTVDQPAGGYTIVASSGTLTPATSTSFAAQTVKAICASGQSCTADVGTPGGDAQVFAGPGGPALLLESANVNAGAQLNCPGFPASSDPNTYDFLTTTTDRSKVVTVTINEPSTPLHGSAKQILNAQQLCFGAPYQFTTVSGAPATAGTLPDGTSGFIGVLPNCPAVGPCHDRKSDTTILDPSRKLGFDIVLVADIPAGLPGDPHLH